MYSVNLDSIQDFSQIPVQQPEQNSSEISKERPSDFLSMLNNLVEKKNPEPVKENSALAERTQEKLNEKSDTPKEVSEKPVSEKKDSTSEERISKKPSDEVEDKKIAKEDKGGEKGKSLEADNVLQGTVFAKNLGDEKAASKNDASARDFKKVVSANLQANNSLQEGVQNKDALENVVVGEELRIGLAKKNFIDESKSLQENSLENTDAEILSANELLSAMQNHSAQLAASTENAANAKNGIQENKNVSSVKGKKEIKIEVKDLRTKVETISGDSKEIKKDFVRAIREGQNGSVELTMDLGTQSEKNILSLDSQSAAADGSTFQAMLKNQITQNAGDFVRAGNIVLKDNNAGSINLVLHPEELGNVKIMLGLEGKTITGHIVVASREAFNAFGDGADVLRNAFIQSGFEDAHFDVSYSGSEMQFAQQNNSGAQDGSNAQQHGRKIYGKFVEENDLAISQNADRYIDGLPANLADYSVDIVA